MICFYYQNDFIASGAKVVSEVFVGLLKLVSLPVVFFSIVATLSGLKDFSELRWLWKRIVYYAVLTTTIAAIISLCLYLLINPVSDIGYGVTLVSTGAEQTNFSSYLLHLVPTNFVQVFLDNNVIGMMIIAFIMGIASLKMEAEKRDIVNKIFSALFDLILQLTQFILKLLPFAVWAFVLSFLNSLENFNKAQSMLFYVICIAIANFLQAFVILPLLLKMKGISPLETLKGSSAALTLAFFSKSSGATLPTTIKCAQCNLGISEKVSSFSLPICSTINMNACSAFILITVLFVSESHGFSFSAMDLLMWLFLSVGAAIGNAGVPMGCYFMASTYLIAMGIPLNIMGLILPLYSILDMFETAINVWSDVCVTRVIDKSFKKGDIC